MHYKHRSTLDGSEATFSSTFCLPCFWVEWNDTYESRWYTYCSTNWKKVKKKYIHTKQTTNLNRLIGMYVILNLNFSNVCVSKCILLQNFLVVLYSSSPSIHLISTGSIIHSCDFNFFVCSKDSMSWTFQFNIWQNLFIRFFNVFLSNLWVCIHRQIHLKIYRYLEHLFHFHRTRK